LRARLREPARVRTAPDPQRRRWLKVVIASILRGTFALELPPDNRRLARHNKGLAIAGDLSGHGMFFERNICVKQESRSDCV
jgi:hypothetical protein